MIFMLFLYKKLFLKKKKIAYLPTHFDVSGNKTFIFFGLTKITLFFPQIHWYQKFHRKVRKSPVPNRKFPCDSTISSKEE